MLAQLLRRASEALFPMSCETCEEPVGDSPTPFFCRTCWELIRPFQGPACPRCHRPHASSVALTHSPGHECRECRLHEPHYNRAWTLYPYCPPLQDAITLFKYRSKVALADPLSTLLIRALPSNLAVDLVMPVPLHPERLRIREFNQSLLLADRVAAFLGQQLSYRNLVRVIDTTPQTGLARSARLQNLRKAFAVRTAHEIVGKGILLVDDVFTTGTTVNECAKVLRGAGAAQITVLALARSVDVSMVPDTVLPPSAFNRTQQVRS